MDDYQPEPDFDLSPRNNVHLPPRGPENPLGAWAYRCQCTHKSPETQLLAGKTFCFKDNIAMAGVPCLLGTDTFTGWTPKMDATVISRVLANGGTVVGKAVCENLSRGAVSCTAATGPVDNPYGAGYSAGGSSSGTAALVGSGAVDMGLGCDQGGSIRIPAALCGLYGFKATTGLVPYTGIASNDASAFAIDTRQQLHSAHKGAASPAASSPRDAARERQRGPPTRKRRHSASHSARGTSGIAIFSPCSTMTRRPGVRRGRTLGQACCPWVSLDASSTA